MGIHEGDLEVGNSSSLASSVSVLCNSSVASPIVAGPVFTCTSSSCSGPELGVSCNGFEHPARGQGRHILGASLGNTGLGTVLVSSIWASFGIFSTELPFCGRLRKFSLISWMRLWDHMSRSCIQ